MQLEALVSSTFLPEHSRFFYTAPDWVGPGARSIQQPYPLIAERLATYCDYYRPVHETQRRCIGISLFQKSRCARVRAARALQLAEAGTSQRGPNLQWGRWPKLEIKRKGI